MQNRSVINAELELLGVFKLLVRSYEEISVIKMQRVRSSVLSTRRFLESLSEVFVDVRSNYKREIALLLAKKKKLSFSTLGRNGKTVSVLLSANAKLYGDILIRAFSLFNDTVSKTDTDIVIIGKVGREFYEGQDKKRPYTYFDLPDANMAVEDLLPIVSYLVNYERVNVYYGKFANVVTQIPSVSNVSGGEDITSHDEGKDIHKFMFEPSLPEVLNFFEKQVLNAFFKQTVHENELSRLASRIKAMEGALGNIEKEEKNTRGLSRRMKKNLDGKKQQQRFYGMALWAK